MLICRLASSLALEGCPLVPWDDAEGAPDPRRARVSYVDEMRRSLFEFTKERREEQPRDMVNEYRRLIEGQTAINFADDLEDCIVAVDGTLSEFPKQFSVMQRLVEVCEKRGHLLVGISKDSQLHAFGHVLTDEELMARCQT